MDSELQKHRLPEAISETPTKRARHMDEFPPANPATKTGAEIDRYQCELCGKCCYKASYLANHQHAKHGMSIEAPEKSKLLTKRYEAERQDQPISKHEGGSRDKEEEQSEQKVPNDKWLERPLMGVQKKLQRAPERQKLKEEMLTKIMCSNPCTCKFSKFIEGEATFLVDDFVDKKGACVPQACHEVMLDFTKHCLQHVCDLEVYDQDVPMSVLDQVFDVAMERAIKRYCSNE